MSVMLHSITPDTKDTFCIGANPKIAISIKHDAGNGKLASIEDGSDEGLYRAIFHLCKPWSRTLPARAHPDNSAGTPRQAKDLTISDVVRLRDTGMPVDESLLSPEPKTTASVSQCSIDSGNGYSIIFSETLSRAVGDMAKRRF